MMKKIVFFFTISVLWLVQVSCRKHIDIVEPRLYPNNSVGNFEAFWHGLSRNYQFWDYDKVDWDEMYRKYRPLVNENTTEAELKNIFQKMIENLIDGHFSVTGFIDTSFFYISNKNVIEGYDAFVIPDNHFENTIFSMLGSDKQKYEGYIFGTLMGKYQYIRAKTFDISIRLAEGDNVEFFVDMINFMLNPLPIHKGVIIDLRQNGGGATADLVYFAGAFTEKTIVFSQQRSKKGPNRHDYGPWTPLEFYSLVEAFREAGLSANPNTLPCMVLCDRATVSQAEATVMALSVLPQVTVVGDRTFGAHGAFTPASNATLSNAIFGGPFKLPNGWTVTTASQVVKYIDGKVYEGIGFPPDVVEKLDLPRLLNTGRDNQLEKAIQLLPQ
jgi:hypothetical protein